MERLSVHLIVDIVYRLRAGQSVRAICRDLGHYRGTVRRYRNLAKKRGYLDPARPLPEPGEVLAQLDPTYSLPSSNVSSVERSVPELICRLIGAVLAPQTCVCGDENGFLSGE